MSRNVENVRAALDSEVRAGTMTEHGTRRDYDWDRLAFEADNRAAKRAEDDSILGPGFWRAVPLGVLLSLLIVGAVVGLSWAVGMLAHAAWAEGWVAR